ncbi:MAG: RNA polymerase sigma factor [Planctomycetota bacterium]
MPGILPKHSNSEWIAALSGEGAACAQMLSALEVYVRRALAVTLRRRALLAEELDDLIQESFSQILANLHTFRGDSAVPTWAVAVATRVAFTELRRRDQRAKKHVPFEQAQDDATSEFGGSREFSPEVSFQRKTVLEALESEIETALTPKQRIATLALLRGVPTIEIAERTGSNQNAVYKLVHDARLRLREVLERRGITVDVITDLSIGEGQP